MLQAVCDRDPAAAGAVGASPLTVATQGWHRDQRPRQRRPFWTIARRDGLAGYLFVAPQLVGIVVFVLIPLGLVFWYSLHEWNVLANTFRFVGDANYQQLLDDPALPEVLRRHGAVLGRARRAST